MSQKISLTDYSSHSFSPFLSNEIFKLVEKKECRFCGSKLNPNKAEFYKHEGGWETSLFKDKVWIWFSCTKYKHQWSLNHLGVNRSTSINL